MESKSKVCVLGMGFVGLTLAVAMAESNHEVIGVEINQDTVNKLSSGNAHFYEVGLESRLRRMLQNGMLKITNRIDMCFGCENFIITVGTPLNKEGKPYMDMVKHAATEVASVMADGAMVILRSTVRLGTTRNIVLPILEATGRSFGLAYCPERSIEGNALAELHALPQICGGLNEKDSWRAALLFQSLTPTTIRVSQPETAELVKLLDNSYRDLFFAFANEVALICEAVGLNANEVIRAANLGYERTNIARPGLVGGPCLEKDPHILAHGLHDFDYVPELINTGRRINEALPLYVANQLACLLKDAPQNLKISVCGMAFKGRPETDDLRGSPSIIFLEGIRGLFPKADIFIQDFACTDQKLRSFFGCEPTLIEDAFKDAHLVVIANNNTKYEWLDIDKLFATMNKPGLVYDFWNVLPVGLDAKANTVKYVTLGDLTKG